MMKKVSESANETVSSPPLEGAVPHGLQLAASQRLRKRCFPTLRNKAGKLGFRAELDGQDVKVYEAFSHRQALFISELSGQMPELFPQVIAVSKQWVIAAWEPGAAPRKLPVELQVDLLSQLHNTTLEFENIPDFSYVRDLLLPRFGELAEVTGFKSWYQELLAEKLVSNRPVLSHPDLTRRNLVRKSTGGLCVIDNELLSFSSVPLLDLCNVASDLSPKARAQIFRVWFERHEPPSEREYEEVSVLWFVRVVGSQFLAGDFRGLHKSLHMLGNPRDVKDWFGSLFF